MNNAVADMTAVILAVFRLNGLLIAAGDRLAMQCGFTGARWQVMGAIAMSPQPLTMPAIADVMGLTRQAVFKQINSLVTEGYVQFSDNRRHKRSPLCVLTPLGQSRYDAVMKLQAPWAELLSDGLTTKQLGVCLTVLTRIESRLVGSTDAVLANLPTPSTD